jgi:hypothetical protein
MTIPVPMPSPDPLPIPLPLPDREPGPPDQQPVRIIDPTPDAPSPAIPLQ